MFLITLITLNWEQGQTSRQPHERMDRKANGPLSRDQLHSVLWCLVSSTHQLSSLQELHSTHIQQNVPWNPAIKLVFEASARQETKHLGVKMLLKKLWKTTQTILVTGSFTANFSIVIVWQFVLRYSSEPTAMWMLSRMIKLVPPQNITSQRRLISTKIHFLGRKYVRS